jgi:integrase
VEYVKGRFPFLTYANEYLDKRQGFIGDNTLEVLRRKARYLNGAFVELKQNGKLSTTCPTRFTSEDIGQILVWMRAQDYENSYKEKLLGLIQQVTLYAGNPVFARMKAEGGELPHRTPKTLNALSEQEVRRIIEGCEEIKGWTGDVCRFLAAMYPYTGLRPSELRRAELVDINTKTWEIWVRHPKGEHRYAEKRTVPILAPARPAVTRYLRARMERLKEVGMPEATPLIPCTGETDKTVLGNVLSENHFRKLKKAMVVASNIKFTDDQMHFSLKTFRDSFCQMNIDRDKNALPAVSRAMGHSSTAMTEKNYGRIRSKKANEALNQLWDSPHPDVKSGVIENRFEMTGYN